MLTGARPSTGDFVALLPSRPLKRVGIPRIFSKQFPHKRLIIVCTDPRGRGARLSRFWVSLMT
jgi:hypothetical protein